MLSHRSLSEVLPLEGQNTIVPNRCLCAALKLSILSSPKSVLDFREDNLSMCVMAVLFAEGDDDRRVPAFVSGNRHLRGTDKEEKTE